MAETLTELVAKIKTDSTELEKGLSSAEKQTEASSKKMAASLKTVGIAMAASGAAITAALGLMGKAAIDEDINIKRLATTINNSGTAYDKVKDSLEAVIATTQRKTGVADNEQRDILNRLILVTNDYGKAMELLPTVLDLAAAGEMDATTAATYLGKAYLELEDGAEEVSVRFGQASLQFKDMADITDRVRGSAEDLKNPFTAIKNSMDDVAEAIGKNLIPLIKEATRWIEDISIIIQKWATDNPELSRTLTLIALALGSVLTVVGVLGLAIPPLVTGVKALITVFGALKLVTIEYTLIALAAVVAIYGIINLVRSLKGEAYVGTSIGDTVFGQIKQDIASLMSGIQGLLPTLDGLNDEIDTTTKAGDNLSDTLDPKLSKALNEVNKKADDLTSRFADLMRKLEDAESDSGKLGLTMDDVYTSMYKLGYKTEEINDVFKRYGDVTEIDEALLDELGLTANDVARITGKLKDEIDKGTESFKQYGEEAKKANDSVSQALMTLAQAKAGRTSGVLTEAQFDAIYNARQSAVAEVMAKEGISKEAALALVEPETYGSIARYVEAVAKEVPQYLSDELHTAFGVGEQGVVKTVESPYAGEYATGGVVPGTIGQPMLATVHGGETIIPANESMGNVVVNFTQPVFFDREDTMNRFVQMIRSGIQRQDRLRFGGAYNGG